jgi:uncharacterized protein YdcH (DUF465 family)
MQVTARKVDMSARIEALHRRHQECEERLRGFEGRKYVSPAEEAEIRKLKHEKLAAKDELARIDRVGNA